jgi:hypothetical protein
LKAIKESLPDQPDPREKIDIDIDNNGLDTIATPMMIKSF